MARDLVGKMVGGHRLGEALGKGRASTVYEAEHAASGRTVAVKVYTADLSRDKNAAARLVAEFQKATAPKHPHLAEVLDAGTVEHKGKRYLYVVMERLRGETLRQRLATASGGALPLAQALRIAADVCAAVAALQREGQRHGAICPEAVFLAEGAEGEDGEARVKLLDLGDSVVRAAEPGAMPAPRAEDDTCALALLVEDMLGGIGGAGAAVLPLRQRNRDVPAHVDMAVRRALSGEFSGAAPLVAALLGTGDTLPEIGAWSAAGTLPPAGARSNLAMGWMVVAALAVVGAILFMWWDRSQGPQATADLASPPARPDLSQPPAADLAPPAADLAGPAPDLSQATPEATAPAHPPRKKRSGPPIPPLRTATGAVVNITPPAAPAAPAPEAAPAPHPPRKKRSGPPIPPLRR